MPSKGVPPAHRGRGNRRKGARLKRPAPHQATDHPTAFDRLAERLSRAVGSAYFFATCTAAVVAWALFGPASGYSDSWQLFINSGTTIFTFLMVALLQNSTRRTERALQHKLDAIADALADFMRKAPYELDEDVEELENAVGLEKREGMR